MIDPVAASSVAGPSSPQLATGGTRRIVLGLSLLALALATLTLIPVGLRVVYPYDLVAWPDDYVFNELLKLRLGAPLYGAYRDANSFGYTPGGVLLHHALLAPLGLDLSLVANRILAQLWLVLAVALAVWLVTRISVRRIAHAGEWIAAAAGAAALLALAGYSNPVADSLNPATLELLCMTIACAFAAKWPALSRLARVTVVLVLPACALLAKQSGLAVGLALATVAWTTSEFPRRERLVCAVLSLVSPAITFAALVVATHGGFLDWGVILPWRQPFMLHHLRHLVTYIAAVAPLWMLIASGAVLAWRGRAHAPNAAWLRVLPFPIAYFVVALPAFLRVGGGAFELAGASFLCAILGLAQLQNALTDTGMLPRATVAMLIALQLLLFAPYRLAPRAAEREAAADVCAHAHEALACGERVFVDLGTACLADAPVRELPRDRLSSLMELGWAGLASTSGLVARLAREDYDFLAIHYFEDPWHWTPAALGALHEHYVPFVARPLDAIPMSMAFGLVDRLHFDDRQAMDLGVFLFERKREFGRHRVRIEGPASCQRALPLE